MKETIEHKIAVKVASDFEIPIEKVLLIARNQFEFTKYVMKKSGFDSVKLPYFGKFKVNPTRVKKLTEKKINQKVNSDGIIFTRSKL